MSAPVLEENEEDRPLRGEEALEQEEQEEMINDQKLLGKFRSDFISNVDRQTMADQKDLFVSI